MRLLPLHFCIPFLMASGSGFLACGSQTESAGSSAQSELETNADFNLQGTEKTSQALKRYFSYVGSGANFIGVSRFDPKTGSLLKIEKFSLPGARPTFLAIHPNRKWIFAANESGNGGVIALSIDPSTGKLTKLNEVMAGGPGPAHVGIDPSGRWVFSANYATGKVVTLPIRANGSLGLEAANSNAGQNAHQVVAAPHGMGVYVPCKGANHIAQYKFDAQSGALTPLPTANIPVLGGPRHMSFHPVKPWAFVVQETAKTIQALSWNSTSGLLSKNGGPVSTLGAGAQPGTSAEVQIHPNGHYLYVSNRGDDSIARFEIGTAGRVSFKETTPTGGKNPRHFSIDPTGQWLLVGNASSNIIAVFSMHPETGMLKLLPANQEMKSPQFVQVVEIP